MKVNSTDMTKGDEDRWVHKWIYDRYKNKNKNTANPALINKRKKKGAENSDEEWRTQLRLHFFFCYDVENVSDVQFFTDIYSHKYNMKMLYII